MKMANVTIELRRKSEGRTNYKRRLALLKSRLPRVVARRTNKHMLLQLVEYVPSGDLVRVGISSKVLEK
ncbi:MAG: 50S ribosomal protein L18, partial [Nitrosarchaeum sp.]|nr:50S ribosomal protein L18 [Nitrosarchaeum sp.]